MMLLSSIIQIFETEFLATYKAVLPSQLKALSAHKTMPHQAKPGDDGAMLWL